MDRARGHVYPEMESVLAPPTERSFMNANPHNTEHEVHHRSEQELIVQESIPSAQQMFRVQYTPPPSMMPLPQVLVLRQISPRPTPIVGNPHAVYDAYRPIVHMKHQLPPMLNAQQQLASSMLQLKQEPLDLSSSTGHELSPMHSSTPWDDIANGTPIDEPRYYLSQIKPMPSQAIINELFGHVMYDFSMDGDVHVALLKLDTRRHIGHGCTKALAQASAADEALRDLVLTDIDHERSPPARIIPYSLLFSHALFKLVNEWDPSGTVLSRIHGDRQSSFNRYLAKSRHMPQQPERMHPMVLLAKFYPLATYTTYTFSGLPYVSCTAGERVFTSVGKCTEDAKRLAAKEACEVLLGINYGPD